ncbi:MAG: exodeoxyribonuclease VII large subunit [Candidatus Aenigmarchaeota archaeon]|nr:exodeoxyribonuclease VII large subunit [Candidatus Aenigmarchaeota archaeon]NIP39936.1 exodeoxyribonuclease VII large subunit [Candidatus Aenigmarchaeota archaeon]NIQ17655.1 exodeoxyribonuclease VII large subunit [Candidatus Aenigmarchaeota archaeon]NIS72843.1 exodeoxyribonuclease VII large subunit [Candidatus Aenigmarchaeota archaeon]
MNEVKLTKISFFGVVIGLIAIYFLATQIHSFHVNIGEIDSGYVGRTVNITGRVTDLTTNKGNMFFDLEDKTGKIKVVLWKDTLELLELSGVNINEIGNGEELNIVGNVQLYKGELEVIPIREHVKVL